MWPLCYFQDQQSFLNTPNKNYTYTRSFSTWKMHAKPQNSVWRNRQRWCCYPRKACRQKILAQNVTSASLNNSDGKLPPYWWGNILAFFATHRSLDQQVCWCMCCSVFVVGGPTSGGWQTLVVWLGMQQFIKIPV